MLMLDSGAFTAWKKQEPISVQKYTKFCLRHQHLFDVVVSLDVIPGKWGKRKLSRADREQAAAEGWYNYQYMKAQGVNPKKLMHIFHQGEEFKWLSMMVDEMDFIGISPGNDRNTDQKRMWLDDCMYYLIGENGYPKVKFHGFAMTALPLMFRYPWYSVDSSMWCQWAGYGLIAIPPLTRGGRNYKTTPIPLSVTKKSASKEVIKDRVHIDTFSPKRKKETINFIESQGFNFEELRTNYKVRYGWNIKYFREVEKHSPEWPPYWGKPKRGGLRL